MRLQTSKCGRFKQFKPCFDQPFYLGNNCVDLDKVTQLCAFLNQLFSSRTKKILPFSSSYVLILFQYNLVYFWEDNMQNSVFFKELASLSLLFLAGYICVIVA